MILVTGRNQFWQTWQKFFDKNGEFSDQFPKVTKKFPKETFSLNESHKHVEWPFDNPGELFLPESKIFLSESPKVINKTLQLLQNFFNSKSSSGHEECSFDNPVDKYSKKSRSGFAQCPKMIGGKITADTSSQNDAIASWNAVPTTQSYNFRKKWTLSLTVGTRKCKVFIGKCFCSPCSYVHLEISFDNPVEKFVKKDDGFLPNMWKLYKTSKCCYGHVEGRFDNPMKKFLTESRKIFGRGPNK